MFWKNFYKFFNKYIFCNLQGFFFFKVFFIVYIVPLLFIYFFQKLINEFKLIYLFFYQISFIVYVPSSNDDARVNRMIIVFRQFILENDSWITLVLTSEQLSFVVLEIIGILSIMAKGSSNSVDFAFDYLQNPDIFIEKYVELYCIEFKVVRENMRDHFTPETLRHAKFFLKKIINFSLKHPDSKICDYVKLIKIKKWWLNLILIIMKNLK